MSKSGLAVPFACVAPIHVLEPPLLLCSSVRPLRLVQASPKVPQHFVAIVKQNLKHEAVAVPLVRSCCSKFAGHFWHGPR